MKLRLGTRGSTLAVTQSNTVADLLRAQGHEVEVVRITTRGDRERGSLMPIAGLGVFAAEVRAAVLTAECDLAVHSLKDLPVEPVEGLHVAAIPRREDPRDALCARDGLRLADLPAGARVGTGSPRRVAQLRRLRPDLEYVEIRGNVDTRLARVAPGDLDAVMLAAAGLSRLGLTARVTDFPDILPAPGQGALAVECRSDDQAVTQALAALDHPTTRVCVAAERMALGALGGGCAAPIGAFATADELGVELDVRVCALDGSDDRTVRVAATTPEEAGREAALRLLRAGAADIVDLQATRPSQLHDFHTGELWPPSRRRPTVLIPREPGAFGPAIEALGIEVISAPVQQMVPLEPGKLPDADWVVVTSARTVGHLRRLGWQPGDATRVAAVGPATAAALESAGFGVDLVPEGPSSGQALLNVFPDGPGAVTVPCSQLAAPTVPAGLRSKGWRVSVVPVYTMEPLQGLPPEVLSAWQEGRVDAVLVTSGSVARSLDTMVSWRDDVRVLALGAPTAETLAGLGVPAAIAPDTDAATVAATMRDLLGKGQA